MFPITLGMTFDQRIKKNFFFILLNSMLFALQLGYFAEGIFISSYVFEKDTFLAMAEKSNYMVCREKTELFLSPRV